MRPNRRYSEDEKKVLLATVTRAQELSDQPLNWILDELGLTRSVYYGWLDKAQSGRLADHVGRGLLLLPCLRRLKRPWITPRFVPGMDIAVLPG